MDNERPAPALPALQPELTKRDAERIVRIGDYLGRFAGYPQTMKRRKVLTRKLRVIDGGSQIAAPEPRKRVAHYIDTFNGVTEIKAMALPAPVAAPVTAPSRTAVVIKWLLARAAEPSSWRGLAMALTAIGITVAPDAAEKITALGIAIAGIVGMVFPDQPSTD